MELSDCILIKLKMHCGMPLCLSMPGESMRILSSLLFLIMSFMVIVGLAYIVMSS